MESSKLKIMKNQGFVVAEDFLQLLTKARGHINVIKDHFLEVNQILNQIEQQVLRTCTSKQTQTNNRNPKLDFTRMITKLESIDLNDDTNIEHHGEPLTPPDSEFQSSTGSSFVDDLEDMSPLSTNVQISDNVDTLSRHSSSSTDTAFSTEMEVEVKPHIWRKYNQTSTSVIEDDGIYMHEKKNVKVEDHNQKVTPSIELRNERSRKLQDQVKTEEPLIKIKKDKQSATKVDVKLKMETELLSCQFCGKSYPNKSSLRQHTAFHRPYRPFKCDFTGCIKAYKTKSELNRHKVIHSGNRDFECSLCNRRFLRKQYLKSHLIKHPTAILFPCSQCTKIYISKTDLDCHTLTYHRSSRYRYNKITSSSEL